LESGSTSTTILLITDVQSGQGGRRISVKPRTNNKRSNPPANLIRPKRTDVREVSAAQEGSYRRMRRRTGEHGENGKVVTKQKLRKKFPETWIWEEFDSGTDGTISVVRTVPDTITSWTISAFQINEQRGIGFSDYAGVSLVVTRPFFVSMDLPTSLVQGEALNLQVNVYNYQLFSILAHITIHNEDKF